MTSWSYPIRGGDYARGGAATRSLKELVKSLGGGEASALRRLMVAAYEAEMNVVIHASGGVLEARLDGGEVRVEVRDEGPGIADVALAMKPGYSTAPAGARALGFGAGLGLPNIRSHSDAFELESSVGIGTRVRFRIALAAPAPGGRPPVSLRVRAERCRGCRRCVAACPTEAIRCYRGAPLVLAHRCIECTACIASCPAQALDLDCAEPEPASGVLVTPPAALARFGSRVAPEAVLGALRSAGWEVRLTSPWERAQAAAVAAWAATRVGQPSLAPSCPAVVSLIEARYPGLVDLLAPTLSGLEAAAADAPAAARFLCLCPAQRSSLLAGGIAPRRLLGPGVIGDRVRGSARRAPWRRGHPVAAASGEALTVTGLPAVTRTLAELEDGLLDGAGLLELWACPYGCAGSGLLPLANPAVAAGEWAEAAGDAAPLPPAHARPAPYAARRGLRLDPDMAKAVAQLRRIDEFAAALPGRDCGSCGAPSCRALAEDAVLDRVPLGACPDARAGGGA